MRLRANGLVLSIAFVAAMMLAWAAFSMLSKQPGSIPPTGPYAVGDCSLDLMLTQAIASNSASGSSAAAVGAMVQLWYPVQATGRDGSALPPSQLPLIFYFSSWAGTALENTNLVRELVSRGFAVVSVIYPGRSPGQSQGDWERERTQLEEPMDFSSESAFNKTVSLATERVEQRSADASKILDGLASAKRTAHANCPVSVLDLDRVGIMGYSIGGAVASETAVRDPRFRAAVNLDGWQFSKAAADGVNRPFLLMSDASPPPTEADLAAPDPVMRYTSQLSKTDLAASMSHLRQYGGLFVTVAHAGHESFSSAAILSWRHRLRGGTWRHRRVQEVVNAYVGAFFERVFKNQDSPLLHTNSASFPDADLQVWQGSAWPPVSVNKF